MKITGERGAPLVKVIIELSPQEWHDLQVIANVPKSDMAAALRYSCTLGPKTSGGVSTTYNVYGLLERIRDAEV